VSGWLGGAAGAAVWLVAVVCAAVAVPAPLLELELPIATPPTATATAAAPAAMDLASLRENMETAPVVRWQWSEARALR
jgi:hypothetical protein